MSRASEHARAVGDILRQKANATSAGAQRNAQIWGGTLATLGEIAGNVPLQLEASRAAKAQEQQATLFPSLVQKHQGDLDKAIEELLTVDPAQGMKYQGLKADADKKAFDYRMAEFDGAQKRVAFLSNLLGAAKDQESWVAGLYTAARAGIDVSEIPPEYDPKLVESYNRELMTAAQRLEQDKPKPPTPVQIKTMQDGQEVTQFVTPEPGASYPVPPAVLTPDQVADNARMTAAQTETERHNKAMEARQSSPTTGRQWVIRNGQPMRVAEGDIQPGDTPYRAPTSTGDTAIDRQRNARTQAARQFLGRLNTLREKINTKMGPEAGLTGMARQGMAAVGWDPDVAEYERERAAGGRALAVAMMGAQNLSDADAKAWADMLPGARVDEETAKRLMAQVETMLNESTDAAPVPTVTPAASNSTGRAQPVVGSVVMFQGKRYTVVGITNGQADLEPVP